MKAFPTTLALLLVSCGAADRTDARPRDPVCLTGGLVPADESMIDYGTSYSPGTYGPATAAPPSRVARCDDRSAPATRPPATRRR